MEHFLTSDLHNKSDWMEQILSSSSRFASTTIAGDLVNQCDESVSEADQVNSVFGFCQLMEANESPLIFTSGNHDLDDLILLGEINPDLNDLSWMDFPDRLGMKFVSGYNRIREFEDLVVLSLRWIPWVAYSDPDAAYSALCTEAKSIAKARGIAWAIVYHEPPRFNSLVTGLIERFSPDFYFCGHDHFSPINENKPLTKFGNTIAINCGQNLNLKSPVSGVLDPTERTFTWNVENSVTFNLENL